ncbi:hypothetical protein ACVNPS_05085 [Candidatus Bipolaricaulota sp. J31]
MNMGRTILFTLLGVLVFGAVIYMVVRLAVGGRRGDDGNHHDCGSGGHCC